MNNWINLMVYANEQMLKKRLNTTGYDDDNQADWGDGNLSGACEAYEDIIRHCAEQLANSLN